MGGSRAFKRGGRGKRLGGSGEFGHLTSSWGGKKLDTSGGLEGRVEGKEPQIGKLIHIFKTNR